MCTTNQYWIIARSVDGSQWGLTSEVNYNATPALRQDGYGKALVVLARLFCNWQTAKAIQEILMISGGRGTVPEIDLVCVNCKSTENVTKDLDGVACCDSCYFARFDKNKHWSE